MTMEGRASTKQARCFRERIITGTERTFPSARDRYIVSLYRIRSIDVTTSSYRWNLHELQASLSSLTSSFDMDNSDGKASLKRQKSPETTTDQRQE